MRNYNIANLKPSDIRWLTSSISNEQVESVFLRKIADYLLTGSECIATLDSVWCDGMVLRPVVNQIIIDHILNSIYNKRKEVFVQGLNSQPFNPTKEL
jgi:hypothetical protein